MSQQMMEEYYKERYGDCLKREDEHLQQLATVAAERDALRDALKNLCRGGGGNRAQDWDDAEKALAQSESHPPPNPISEAGEPMSEVEKLHLATAELLAALSALSRAAQGKA